MGCVLLFVGFLLSFLSTWVILLGASRLNANTYGVLVDRSLNYAATLCGLPAVDCLFFLYLLACEVSFLMFLGDFIPSLTSLSPSLTFIDRTVVIYVCALCIICPFVASNEMNFVRHIANFGILAVLFTCCVVIGKACTLIPEQGDAVGQAWARDPAPWDMLQSSGIIVFAFCIGANVPSIAVEMKEPTVYNTFLAAIIGNTVMLICYRYMNLLHRHLLCQPLRLLIPVLCCVLCLVQRCCL